MQKLRGVTFHNATFQDWIPNHPCVWMAGSASKAGVTCINNGLVTQSVTLHYYLMLMKGRRPGCTSSQRVMVALMGSNYYTK